MAQDFGKVLYDRLPSLYKKEDAKIRPQAYPLKRFLQVTGVGLNELDKKVEDYTNLFDIDKAPAIFLPELARMMGFSFPYEMTEREQRQFLKVLPTLYKFKGTNRVFDYLGQVIFGADARASSGNRLADREDGLGKIMLLDLLVEANGEIKGVNAKHDQYAKFSEIFRPLNSDINHILSLFYSEAYEPGDIFLNDDNMDIVLSTDLDIKSAGEYREHEDILFMRMVKPFEDAYELKSYSDEQSYLSDSGTQPKRLGYVLNNNFRLNSYPNPFSEIITMTDEEFYDMKRHEFSDTDSFRMALDSGEELYNRNKLGESSINTLQDSAIDSYTMFSGESPDSYSRNVIHLTDSDSYDNGKVVELFSESKARNIAGTLNHGVLNSTLKSNIVPPIVAVY